MARNQNPKGSFSSFLGAAMLIVGSAVQVIYSAALAWQYHEALSRAVDSVGLLGTVGLASLRVVRAATLDHAALLSVAHHILILFSAFVVMLVGITLLRRRAAGLIASDRRNLSAPPTGDQ
jgi:hypothetical protein